VPAENLRAEAESIVTVLRSGPAAAYAETKRLIGLAPHRDLAAQLDDESATIGRLIVGSDATEGVDAFLAKRAPVYACVRARASRRRPVPQGTSVTRIAVIGAGTIGQALLLGLMTTGRPPEDLAFVHRTPIRAAQLSRRQLGLRAVSLAAAATHDVAELAVKPQDSTQVLAALAHALRPGTLVVSLCARVATSTLEAALPAGTPVVRAMPNTPMTIGAASDHCGVRGKQRHRGTPPTRRGHSGRRRESVAAQ
jgi:hypothetical protein